MEKHTLQEGDYTAEILAWSCQVANEHDVGGEGVNQRTVMRLDGRITAGPVPVSAIWIYLIFEPGAGDDNPRMGIEGERLRLDVMLLPGQEAAALAILEHHQRAEVRFTINVVGNAVAARLERNSMSS